MQSKFHKALMNTIKKVFKKSGQKWTFILLCHYENHTLVKFNVRYIWVGGGLFFFKNCFITTQDKGVFLFLDILNEILLNIEIWKTI